MRILGVVKKPRFVGQVFNLNHTSAIFSDNTGRHDVSTGAGVTSVGGKASFAWGNGGVHTFGGDQSAVEDFAMTKMGDFDVSFKFQMTAEPYAPPILFVFGDPSGSGYGGIQCYISGELRVTLYAAGLTGLLVHPKTQVEGAAEQTVLITRRGLLYTLTVDGSSVSATALSIGEDMATSALMLGSWPSQTYFWAFVGTIRDFVVTKV